MPRQRKQAPPKPEPIPGVRWRRGLAYYEREHKRLPGGRVFRSLGIRDHALAQTYAAALNTLMDRGDWAVIERWRRGEIHITDIARAVRDGEYGALRRMEGTRLGTGVQRFLRRAEGAKKARTAESYTTACGLLVAELGKDFPMAQLTRERAERFLHDPKSSTGNNVWQARTQGLYRTVYGALWRMVIEDEAEEAKQSQLAPAVTENPWKRAAIPEQRTTRHAFLSTEQWATLMAHPKIAGTPQAAFLGCGCLAGLRQQEIANLRTVIDVDLEAGVIRVQDRKGAHGWTAKRPTTQRDVPIVPALRQLLEDHIRLGFAGERFFFRTARRDRPLSPTTTKEWTQAAFEAAGIRYGREGDALTLHSLRHTFGTWLTLDGVPFTVTASLMGDTPETVMHYYSHWAPSDREAAMLRIQERVG